MLKTNSKKAIENLKNYIMKNFDADGYNFTGNAENFHEVAKFIYNTFIDEFCTHKKIYNFQEMFCDWCAGLPSILDTCYYYNRSAVDDLGEILEETEEEKAHYTEEKAEKLLSSLIYMQISKEARRK